MHQKRLIVLPFVVLVAIATAGCGGSGLKSVSGTVTFGGKPLTTGTVTFHPVGGGPIGTATIQSDGSFTASTGAQRGVAPGQYQITVAAYGPLPKPTPQNLEPIPPQITPPKYANPKTSGLKCTVPLKGSLDLKLEPQ